MDINTNYSTNSNYMLSYKAIEQIKRAHPIELQPLTAVESQKDSKPKYNWKTVAVVAGVSALALLGIAKRKSIMNVLKNISTNQAEHEPYFNPNMKLSVDNVNQPKQSIEYVNPRDIVESYEPEMLSDLGLHKKKTNQKQVVYVDQKGNLIDKTRKDRPKDRPFGKKMNTGFAGMWGRSQRVNPRNVQERYTAADAFDDATDAAINFAIFDDIVNGGKEIKAGFDFVKNAFKSGSKTDSVIADGTGGADDILEHSSSIIDRIAEGFSDVTDSISDIGESIIDSLGDLA